MHRTTGLYKHGRAEHLKRKSRSIAVVWPWDLEEMAMVTRSSRMVVWGAVVLVMGLCSVLVESQGQCAGSDLTKLYACLSAAKADVMPSAACCQGLGSFNSDAGTACLCAASSDPRFMSAGGKPQFAALIPKKCNLRYKAGIKCNGVVIPGGQ